MRVAIYLRMEISKVKPGAAERQETACRGFVEREGHTVAGVYADVRRTRKEYRRLLTDMSSGNFDAVVAETSEKFGRSDANLMPLFDAAEPAGCAVYDSYGVRLTRDLLLLPPAGDNNEKPSS